MVDSTTTAPYAAATKRLAEDTARAAELAPELHSEFRGAPEPALASINREVELLAPALRELSHAVHDHPELGFEEHQAARLVTDFLRRQGIATETGLFGLPTSLRAKAGDGGPRVALLAEYDALPGIGHGCGHNVICATAVGAMVAVGRHIEHLGGEVVLLGTPAEENGTGKELIARAGGFDDVDAVLMLHPYAGYDLADFPCLGLRQVDVAYHGRPAHASGAPFLGRNALDAVVVAYQGVAALRQHILPTDRIHGVITSGGDRPNIVPSHTMASFYVRSADLDTLLELSRRMDEIFAGAASMTGTTVEIRWDEFPPCLPVRSNDALAARYAQHLKGRGRRVLPTATLPRISSGSTDLGNVSLRVPSIHPMLSIAPAEIALHTAEFAASARSPEADAALVDGAVGLALTAADFLGDAAFREAVREDFNRAGGALDVEQLLTGSPGTTRPS